MSQLVKYEAACSAIAECKSIDEVKSWADKAAAMQAYGRMAKDKTLEVDAAEIRIRAERRLGEMLLEQKAEGGLSRGAAGSGVNQHTPAEVRSSVTTAPKLSDAGISKDLSSRAQKLAAVPEAAFEAELSAKRERNMQDGARVSARLEKIGEQQLQKTAAQTEAEQLAEDAHGGTDVLQMLDELQKENRSLQLRIEALTADDQAKKLDEYVRLYEHARRTADDKQEIAARYQRELQRMSDRLVKIGKLFGERDTSKIPALVEKMFRAKEAA